MTITKALKSKLALGILAAALSLSLAIGGTLMLFTDSSETATNVVTLGAARIKLQEATSNDQSYDSEAEIPWTPSENDYKTVGTGEGEIPGITYTDHAAPGAQFAKAPRVLNDGSIPVYVKVEGVLSITPPTGWEKPDELNLTDDYIATIFRTYFDQVVPDYDDDSWDGAAVAYAWVPASDDAPAHAEVKGTWYYANDAADGKAGGYGSLVALEAGKATEPIFTFITLPSNIPNAFKNFNFSFDLTAYAVQSENNDPVGSGLAAYESVFPADDSGYGPWGYQPTAIPAP